MTVKEIMTELQSMGSENIKRIFLNHGIKEPFFGVKVGQLKTIQKKIKKDYVLAKELFATGNADAMYLAGLIADDAQMSKVDLNAWVKQAVSQSISESIVPWVAAGSKHGFDLAKEWINSKVEYIAAAGWATLSCVVALKADAELDIPLLKKLLSRVEKDIHSSSDRVRYTMNGFVISVGTHVTPLTPDAMTLAKKIGTVSISKNGTACQVPVATDYIKKAKEKGVLGKKKMTVKC